MIFGEPIGYVGAIITIGIEVDYPNFAGSMLVCDALTPRSSRAPARIVAIGEHDGVRNACKRRSVLGSHRRDSPTLYRGHGCGAARPTQHRSQRVALTFAFGDIDCLAGVDRGANLVGMIERELHTIQARTIDVAAFPVTKVRQKLFASPMPSGFDTVDARK